jgi:hypothetical protein
MLLPAFVAAACAGAFFVDTNPFIAYVTIGLFGAGALAALANLLPNSAYLELRTDGFIVKNTFRQKFVRWADVQAFYPWKIQYNHMVGWDYQPAYEKSVFSRKVSAALGTPEYYLPDTYGMKVEELAELMNTVRSKSLADRA